jgi:hypothetical protein
VHRGTKALTQEGSPRFFTEINQLNLGLKGPVLLNAMHLSFGIEM